MGALTHFNFLLKIVFIMWTALATLLGAALSAFSQQRNNQTLIEEAQKNRDFQQQMSSTAYQRGVADMKAAGLNPGMMYSGAAMQASTPSGGQASGMEPLLKGMEVSNAVNNMYTIKQAKLADAETSLKKAQAANVMADTERIKLMNDYYPSLTNAQIQEIFSNIGVNTSVEDLNKAHKITADLENDWIPRLRAANAANLDSQTALNQINKYLLDWEKAYRHEYGVRPGDSAIADTTAFICKQLGISSRDTIERIKNYIMDVFSGKRRPRLPSTGSGLTSENILEDAVENDWSKIREKYRYD